ncbi:O-antigen ligase family protein [Acinetobacter seifertii]|nr:O-antigen ligase family protein [Acinetobacter seifertii]QNX60679.1 O-antigen ligase family protein [Acinetobacter seifertii]
MLYSFIIFKFDDSFVLSQAKDILVFFLMFYILTQYANFENKYEFIANTIIKALYYIGLIKVIILLYAFYVGLPVSFVILSLSEFFNTPIMTYDVENTYISRINFTSDLIIPISIFYMLMKFYRKGFSKFEAFMTLIILFSAFITMSRFQWAFSIVAIVFSIMMNVNNRKSFITLISISFISFISLTFQSVQEVLFARFDTKLVNASDMERVIQRQEIEKAISDAPLLGNGIGYYIPNLIRSDIAKYSYELQLHSLIMQLGLFGFVFIFFMILIPLISSAKYMSVNMFVCYFSLILIWISSALFNPMLFSSSAGISMALFYIISKISWFGNKTI